MELSLSCHKICSFPFLFVFLLGSSVDLLPKTSLWLLGFFLVFKKKSITVWISKGLQRLMKESLRYLYQAEPIATRTAQCVDPLAAAGKTYHLTTHILTCFCIDSHTTPQDNLSNTLQYSGQSYAQLSMFSLASVATHCIVPQDLLADLIPLFPTLTNLVNPVPQDVGKTM